MGVAYACAKPLWRRGRAVFAAIVVLLLAACETELYTGLSEREANEIVAVLMNAGIPAEKTFDRDDTLSVVVDQDRFAEAVSILNARGLPRQTFDSIGDIFEKEGLISSPTEERARFIYALSQELSRTVAEIDGVLSARIHVVLPENDAFRRDVRPSSASVFVRHDGAVPLDGLVPQIKMLVANGIEGLVYENVSVVMVPVDVAAMRGAGSPELTQVAGIWVHQDSAATASLVIGALGTALVISLVANGLLLSRRQRAQGRALERVSEA